jgi:hypothetical protein
MKFRYITIGLLLLAFTSCKKENPVDISDFEVKTEALSFKEGEEVTFKLAGDPSQVSFYSGEVGNEYEFASQSRIDQPDKINLIFQTHNTPTEAVQYKVLVSTDFDGIYKYDNVKAATWTDLSSRFTWGPPAPWQTMWVSSGISNIADVVPMGKPFYVAFKYNVAALPTGTIPGRNWRTNTHFLTVDTKFGYTSQLANYGGMTWKQVKIDSTLTSASTVTASIMLFSAPTNYRLDYEEWGVSKAFTVGEIDLGVDRSTPIKGYSELPLAEYKYTYSKAGTYRATFVAANKTAYNNKEVVKYVDITITP